MCTIAQALIPCGAIWLPEPISCIYVAVYLERRGTPNDSTARLYRMLRYRIFKAIVGTAGTATVLESREFIIEELDS